MVDSRLACEECEECEKWICGFIMFLEIPYPYSFRNFLFPISYLEGAAFMFWLVSKRWNLKARYTGDQRKAAYSPSAQMPGAFASSGDSEVSAVDLQRESQTSGRP